MLHCLQMAVMSELVFDQILSPPLSHHVHVIIFTSRESLSHHSMRLPGGLPLTFLGSTW